jgi:hypothetical protein
MRIGQKPGRSRVGSLAANRQSHTGAHAVEPRREPGTAVPRANEK